MEQRTRLPAPAVLLILFFALTFPLWGNGYLTAPDSASYWAVPRSLVRDLDLDFNNDYAALRFRPRYAWLTPRGRISNDWPVGTGVLWLPVHALGEGATRGLAAAGFEGRRFQEGDPPRSLLLPRPVTAGWDEPLLAPTGQSGLQRLLVMLFTALLSGGALYIGWTVAAPLAGPRAATAALFCVLLGTPLGYYTYSFGLMSHVPSMTAVGLLFLGWHRTRGSRTTVQWALLGMAAGLMVMIRPQDAAFLAIFLVELVFERPATRADWIRWARGVAVAAAAAVLVFLPQAITWQCLYGNPLQLPKVGEMRWLSPAVAGVLFSDYHGLVSWSPVLALVPAGLWFAWKSDRCLASAMATAIALQIYLNAANEFWWASGSFGNRRFINCGVLFVVAIALALRHARPVYIAPPVVAAVAWTLALWARERAGGMVLERYEPWTGRFVLETLAMLRPDRLFTGLLGDLAGFGWPVRIALVVAGSGLALWMHLRPPRWSPRAVRLGLIAPAAAYLCLVPLLFLAGALRTPVYTPADLGVSLPARDISIFNNHYEAGYFHVQKGRMEEAARSFRRAVELVPDDPMPLRYLAEIELRANDRPGEALLLAGLALDLRPDYDQALEIFLLATARLSETEPARRAALATAAATRLRAAGRHDEAAAWEARATTPP